MQLKTTLAFIKTSKTNATSKAINWEPTFSPFAIISAGEGHFATAKVKVNQFSEYNGSFSLNLFIAIPTFEEN